MPRKNDEVCLGSLDAAPVAAESKGTSLTLVNVLCWYVAVVLVGVVVRLSILVVGEFTLSS
jgi:hypothetical protein